MRATEIIAEIGNTHEGSLGLAKAFIKAAADCGVDRVKFQTHIFEAESLPNAPTPPYFKDESRKEYFDRTGASYLQRVVHFIGTGLAKKKTALSAVSSLYSS